MLSRFFVSIGISFLYNTNRSGKMKSDVVFLVQRGELSQRIFQFYGGFLMCHLDRTHLSPQKIQTIRHGRDLSMYLCWSVLVFE